MRNFKIIAMVPALLLACGVKFDGDQGASTGEAGSSGGTDGVSSTPTTGSVPDPTGDPSVVTNATASADPPDESGAGSTQVDTGDTEGDSGDEEGSTGSQAGPCDGLCEAELACGIEVDPRTCVTMCEDGLAALADECRAVMQVELICFAGLTCEQLSTAIHEEGPHPCIGEVHDVELACGEESCNVGGGGDEMGTFCQLEIDCPDQPHLEMKCDTQTCVCTEDGVMTGSCEAAGVCDDLNTLGEFGPGCCGFPEVDL